MRDDQSYVAIIDNPADPVNPWYRGECPACDYHGSTVRSSDLALQLLNLHRKNRLHISTTNTAHRFHVQ